MTPTQFREALEVMGWSQRRFADFIQFDERTVRRWASGAANIPDDIADWLRCVSTHMHENPPPQRRTALALAR